MAGNYYTTAGKGYVVNTIDGTAAAPANIYLAWGTGVDTGIGSTALSTESTQETRVATTKSHPSTDKNQFVATITCATAGKTITEAGILSASTVGTLILYTNFTGVALNVGDSIQFTFSLQQT